MMDFRDVAAEEQIRSFVEYFDRVNYPLQPLSTETKAFFGRFFGGNGFVTFCDLLLGSYCERYLAEDEEMCWMDYANLEPTKSFAVTLLSLIHPSSTFISTLEALSTPSATFGARLKKGWKNSTAARSSSFYSLDLPLVALHPQFFKLMGEPADLNLYALPRSRCHPILLVPFWDPPVVTRRESSQQQVMTSLPCLPMGYFLFRLLLFGMKRVQRNSADFLAWRKKGNIAAWMWRAKDELYSAFYKRIPVDMPFYAQLLQSYIQIYVSATLSRHLCSKRSIADIIWTTNDATASVLILAPELLAHRELLQPVSENDRVSCKNPETLAQILFVVPLYTRMVYAMSEESTSSPFMDCAAITSSDYSVGFLSKAQADIENIRKTLYRNCLTVLRECFLSLELEPYCKNSHFTYCLELWAVLMNPFEKQQKMAPPQYVAQHFESFGFLAVDVLNMIVKSSFVYSMTEAGAKVLKKCFLLLSQDPVVTLLVEINASQPSSHTVAEMLARHFVLDWIGSDGGIQLPNLHGSTTCSLAARAYVSLERLINDDTTEVMRGELKETLSLMECVFPRITQFLDTWRASEKATPKNSKSASVPTMTVARPLTESEKLHFFRGGKGNPKIFAKGLRLPIRNGRVPGNRDAVLKTSLRNEIPALLGFSRFLDSLIAKILEEYYSSVIPKCDHGHNLYLTYSKNYACTHHAREPAIWECSICEKVYGSCCRGLPCRANGERLVTCNGASSAAQQCIVCGQVVWEDSLMFCLQHGTGAYFCPDCASRPFSHLSMRWIASYRTWAVVVGLFFLSIFISFLA
ncbi:conserved hypothetical protein [Leishmania major strain Friedlin]|uniref:Uncharacterized protein n=1 Tax=Leishmania major TaxID=5664 RepID=E9AFL6_LEIMA|nr:conserved hypothetical protein [Leishmania major strain Friedlin]CAG9582747.1 hypothetical_protein_-_conserved [Leishmania major strain Friedlin]CBZ13020.1 conserved hypothetical protein [Leishmania major strain Friedlin]|eukprot:XP_003722786.1 conserved hypothetical protein [Leishmania major strain Friedlin]